MTLLLISTHICLLQLIQLPISTGTESNEKVEVSGASLEDKWNESDFKLAKIYLKSMPQRQKNC